MAVFTLYPIDSAESVASVALLPDRPEVPRPNSGIMLPEFSLMVGTDATVVAIVAVACSLTRDARYAEPGVR